MLPRCAPAEHQRGRGGGRRHGRGAEHRHGGRAGQSARDRIASLAADVQAQFFFILILQRAEVSRYHETTKRSAVSTPIFATKAQFVSFLLE